MTSARSLHYYLWIMKIALFFKKPVMLYAQGIGPVRGIKARKAVQKVLQQVAVIGVRDRESKAELSDMGVTRPPIHVTADAVLSMHPVDKAIGRQILERHGFTGSRRTVGIAVRNWQGHQPIRTPLPRRPTDCSSKKTWTSSSFPCSIRKTSTPAAILPTV